MDLNKRSVIKINPEKILFLLLLSAALASFISGLIIFSWAGFQEAITRGLFVAIAGPIFAAPALLLLGYPLICFLKYKQITNILLWILSLVLIAFLYHWLLVGMGIIHHFMDKGAFLIIGTAFSTALISWYLINKTRLYSDKRDPPENK